MSKNIDERVVEMRFDNKQFEQGISQSLDSLKKLDKALEFDNVKNSAKELDKLSDSVNKVDFEKMSTQLDALEKRFSAFGIAGMTVVQELTKSLINFGKNAWNNTIGQIKTGGMKRAMNIENAKFQLEGLKVAWESVADDIDYAVSGTAYGLDAAAKACAQLSASGVQAGEDMKKALRAISGVAAMTNAEYDEIAPIFTTVAGQGKLMTMQLRQLESRGLNAAASLGEALGKTEGEIRDMVTKGKIDFNTFANAMDDAFGEHAKDANKTFSGAMSNMKAALSRIGADFAKPYMDMMIKVFNGLRVMFNGIKKELQPVVKWATRTMNSLGDMAEQIFASNEMTNIYKNTMQGLIHIFNGLLTLLYPIKLAFKDVFPEGFLKTIEKVSYGFNKLTKGFGLNVKQIQAVRVIFVAFFTVLKKVGSIVGSVTNAVLPPLVKLLNVIFAVLSKLVGLVSKVVGTITGSISKLNVVETILAGIGKALDFLTTVVAYAAAAVIVLIDSLSKINVVEFATNVFNALAAALGYLVESIGSIVYHISQLKIVQTIINGVITAFVIFGNTVKYVAAFIILSIKSIIDSVIELWNRFEVSDKITKAFTTVKDIFIKIGKEFVKVVNQLKEGKSIFAIIRDEAIKLSKALDTLGKKIQTSLLDQYNSEKFKWLRDIINKLKELIPTAEEAHGKIVSLIKFLKDNANKLIAIGYLALITSVVISFKRLMDTCRGVASNLKNVLDVFKKATPQKSKLEQFADAILKVAVAIGILAAVNKFGDLDKVANTLKGIMIVMGSVVAGLTLLDGISSKLGMGASLKNTGHAIEALGIGVAALAASLMILEKLDFGTSLKNLVIIAGLLAELAVVGKFFSTFKNAPKGAASILAIASSVYLLVNALQKIEGFNTESLAKDIAALSTVIVSLAVATRIAGKVKLTSAVALLILVNQYEKIIPIVEDIATRLKPIASKLKKSFKEYNESWKTAIKGIDWEKVVDFFDEHQKGVLTIAAFFATVVVALGVSIEKASKNMKKVGTGLILIAAAIGLMAQIAKQLALFNEEQNLDKGMQMVMAFAGIIGVFELLAVMTKESKMVKFAASLIIIAGVFNLLTKLAMTISKTEREGQSFTRGLVVLGILTSMIAVLEGMSAKTANSKASTVIALCLTLIALATELVVLSFINWKDLIAPIAGMLVIMGGLAVVMEAMTDLTLSMRKGATKRVIAEVGTVLLAIGEIALAMIVLSKNDWRSVIAAGGGIALALSAFSGAIFVLSKFATNTRWSKAKTEIVTSVYKAIAEIAAAMTVVALFGVSWKRIAAAAVGISAAMLAFSVCVRILSNNDTSKWNQAKTKQLQSIYLAIGELAVAMAAIAFVGGDWTKITAAAGGISGALLAFAGAVTILSVVGNAVSNTTSIIPTMVGAALAIIPLAGALYILSTYDWKGSILETSTALSEVLLAFSIAVGIMSKLGAGTSVFSMAAVSIEMIALAYAMNILASAIKQFEGVNWQTMLPAAVALAALAGSVKLFATVGEAALAALPEVIIGILAIGAACATLQWVSIILQNFVQVVDSFLQACLRFAEGFQLLDGESIKSNLIAIAEGMDAFRAPVETFVAALAAITVTGIPAILALCAALVILSKTLPGIAEAIDKLSGSFDKLKDLDISNLKAQISSMAESFKDFFKVAIEAACIKKAADAIADFVSATEGIKDSATSIGELTKQLHEFADALENAKNALETSGKEITDYIDTVFTNDLVTHMEEAGANAVEGLISGVESQAKIEKLKRSFTNLGDICLSSFDETVGFNSPWSTMIIRGVNGILGLINGTKKGEESVKTEYKTIGEMAVDALSDKILGSDGLNKIGSEGVIQIKDVAIELGNTFKETLEQFNLNDLASQLLGGFDLNSLLGGGTANILGGEGSDVPTWMQEILDKAKDVEDAFTGVANGSGGSSGGGAKGASKETDKLAKALEAMKKTVPVCINMFGDLYKELQLTEDGANAGQEALEALNVTLEEFGDTYDKINKSIDSFLEDIFDPMSDIEFMSKDELMDNMQDHLDVVNMWVNDLTELSRRGLSDGLYQKLAEMGPQSLKYVEGFIDMTEDELERANQVWGQRAAISQDATNKIAAGWLNTGLMCVQGLVNGLSDDSEAIAAAQTTASNTLNAAKDTLGVQSPSVYFNEIGVNCIIGLEQGMMSESSNAVNTAMLIADRIIAIVRARFTAPSVAKIGQELIATIVSGMVLNQATLSQIITPILNSIVTAINTKAKDIRQNGSNICKHLVAGFKDEMKEQQSDIGSAIDMMIGYIEDEFKSGKSQAKIEKLARWLVEVFCTELKNKNTTQKKVKKTLEELFEEMSDPLEELLSEEGETCGKFFVEGLVLGLSDEENTSKASKAAWNLGQEVLAALAESLEEESPSKATWEFGNYLIVGLSNGIVDNSDLAINSVKDLGNKLIVTFKNSMGEVVDVADRFTEVLTYRISDGVQLANDVVKKETSHLGDTVLEGFNKLGANLKLGSDVASEAAEKYIKSYFKIADAATTSTKKTYKALETLVQRTAKSAKKMSESLNKIVPYKLTDGIVKAFVPISEVASETAENVTNASQKMVFKIGKNVKDVGAHINKAIAFAKNLNTVMMDHRGSDTLLSSLSNINKYFIKFKQGKVPDKVLEFLDNLKTEMAPVNDLVDGMTKKFYGVNNALKKHTNASNDARTGLIRFAEKIFESTKVGEEYKKLQEEIAKAEEELAEARADYAKAQEEQNFNGWKSSKTRREEEEALEKEYGKVLEKEEALAELRAKEVPYVNALSNAIKEYRENLTKTILAQKDFYNAVDKTSGAIDPSKLVGNALNFNTALRDYRKGLISLASKSLDADVMQALVEGGVNSIGKINSWNKLDKRTIQLINQISSNAQKKADKATKAAIESVSNTMTNSTIKAQKKFNKQMNEGDKAFKKILKGQIEYFGKTVQEFGVGSKQVDTLLIHMRSAFADLEPVMNLAGETFHGVTDAFSRNDEIAVNLFGSIDKLSDVFGINADKAGDAGEMIAQMTEQLQAYGESVKSALSLSNPFEKFEATEGITKDQLLYNVQSMRDAQVQYEQVYNNLVRRGVAPEILAKMETMGISQGLAYGKALLEATDEELGYFNDVVVQNLKFSEEQEKKAQARMLEACGPLAEAIRKGLNAAFKKNGVTIPLTDPSKVEEQKEEASDAGYDVGESYGDSVNDAVEEAGEETPFCLIEGSETHSNSPKIRKAGKRVAKTYAEGAIEEAKNGGYSEKISEALTGSVENGVSTTVRKSTEKATSGAYETIKVFGSDSEKTLTTNFKKVAEESVKSFQDAINKINQLIQGINTDITIHVNADMSAAQAALDAFNASKQVSMSNAYTTSSSVASSQPQIAWEVSGNNDKAVGGNVTNVTYNQYNTSPKALDAVEIYRQTQKQVSTIKKVAGK